MPKWVGAVAVAAVLAAAGGVEVGPATAMEMGTTCTPAGTSLALTAEGHKFDKDCLAVPADETFTIRFDNKDADRHNVAILPSHTATTTLFEGDILPGPKSLTYNVPALKAGTYHFHCEVHPNLMNGTFIVGRAAAAPMPAPAPTPTPPAATPAPTPPSRVSMGDAKPAPAPAAPAPKMADAAPAAPSAAPAKPDAMAAPSRTAGGTNLPHTGPHSAHLLLILAGAALAAGGLSVLGGARRVGSRA